MDQDATCYGSIGLSPGHIVRFGPSSPSKQKGHSPPIFGPYLLWPNGWIDQDATWYEGRRRPGDIVLDGTQLPPKRGTSPQFSAHACRGQMAGLIKMALGTEVGVGPGDIVLDVDPAPPPKRGIATSSLIHFSSMSIVAKRLDGSRYHFAAR